LIEAQLHQVEVGTGGRSRVHVERPL